MTEASSPPFVQRVRALVDVFWRELAKFGIVGAAAFVIDFVGFNLLFYGPLVGHLTSSKIVAGAVATITAWVGNRIWTFRHRRTRPAHHEALLFFAVNGAGLLVTILYLNLTHDVFGWTSRSAVNVNNLIGIALATVLRFYFYRTVVFRREHPGDPEPVGVNPVKETPH